MSNESIQLEYEKITAKVTESKTAWKDYLTFAARIYKYSFNTALLVYSQNPQATMIASYDVWQRVGRQVRRGETSMTVRTQNGPYVATQHLFDVSQTYGNTSPKVWSLTEPLNQSITNYFNNQNNSNYRNVEEYIQSTLQELLSEQMDSYFNSLKPTISNTHQNISYDNLKSSIYNLIYQSAEYIANKRCDFTDPLLYHDDSMSNISLFSNTNSLSLLGTYVNSLSKEVLLKIEKTANITKKERGLDDERTDTEASLRREGRNQMVTAAGYAERADKPGQVRLNVAEISSGDRSGASMPVRNDGNVGRNISESSEGSTGEVRSDSGSAVRGKSSSGRDGLLQETSVFQLGSRHSGGDSAQGNSDDSSLKPNNPVINKESPEGGSSFVKEKKYTAAQRKAEIEKILYSHGSGFTNGKTRIYNFFVDNSSKTDRVKFLKKEFGIGGAYVGDYNIDYGSKGCKIAIKSIGLDENLSWNQVERFVDDMIRNGNYIEDQKKPEIEQLSFESLLNTPTPKVQHKPYQVIIYDTDIGEDEMQDYSDLEKAKNAALSYIDDETIGSAVFNQDNLKLEAVYGTMPVERIFSKDVLIANGYVKVNGVKNYRNDGDDLYSGTSNEKYRKNIEAINTLKNIELADRNASAAEQKVLAKYSGWGGLADSFDKSNKNYAELKALLSPCIIE